MTLPCMFGGHTREDLDCMFQPGELQPTVKAILIHHVMVVVLSTVGNGQQTFQLILEPIKVRLLLRQRSSLRLTLIEHQMVLDIRVLLEKDSLSTGAPRNLLGGFPPSGPTDYFFLRRVARQLS